MKFLHPVHVNQTIHIEAETKQTDKQQLTILLTGWCENTVVVKGKMIMEHGWVLVVSI